jgi:hypothetical protein
MYAQEYNRSPAPILVVLLLLGIVVFLIFNPPVEQKEPSTNQGKFIPVTSGTETPLAPTPVPTRPAIEQTEVAAQKELAIASSQSTREAIDQQATAAKLDEQKLIWAATTEVRSTEAALQGAEVNAASTQVVNLQSELSVNATQAAFDHTAQEGAIRHERQQAVIQVAAIISIGVAASVTVITAGVATRTILKEHRLKEIAQAERLEQERLVVEARRKSSEARKTLLAMEQGLQAKKVYSTNGHQPAKHTVI